MNQEAQLTVLLTLKDQLTSGVHSASAALSGLSSQSTIAGRGLSTLEQGAGRAWGSIKNLAGSLGLVGLGGGLIAISGLLKSSISDTQQFGEAVLQLHKLTGESAEGLSALASAMIASGTSAEVPQKAIGMMNKLIGGMSTEKQIEYELQYGLSLKDTTVTATQLAGALAVLKDAKASHAAAAAAETLINKYNAASYLSTNQLVLQAADLYNNNLMPAEDKAAALAKMFGRSWQTLIPLFEQGSEGILGVEQQAASMGMVITTENLPAIEKMHDASIKWNQAMGGLQLQIGLALLPALSELADSASAFVTGHKGDIVSFFKGAADFAGQLGGVITNDVLPVLSTLAGWWNTIPGPFQELLIGGGIFSKLTGIGPMDIAKIFTGGGVAGGGGAAGILTATRGTPANPMWVAVVGGGGLGGGGGAGAAAGVAAGGGEGVTAATDAVLAESGLAIGGSVGLAGIATAAGLMAGGVAVGALLGNASIAIAGRPQYGQESTTPLGAKQWSIDPNLYGGQQFTQFAPEDPRSPLHAGYVASLQAEASGEAQRAAGEAAQRPPTPAEIAATASRWAGGAGVKADITGAKAEAAKEAASAAAAVASRWAGPLGVIAQEQAQLKALQAQQLAQQKTGDVRLGSTLSIEDRRAAADHPGAADERLRGREHDDLGGRRGSRGHPIPSVRDRRGGVDHDRDRSPRQPRGCDHRHHRQRSSAWRGRHALAVDRAGREGRSRDLRDEARGPVRYGFSGRPEGGPRRGDGLHGANDLRRLLGVAKDRPRRCSEDRSAARVGCLGHRPQRPPGRLHNHLRHPAGRDRHRPHLLAARLGLLPAGRRGLHRHLRPGERPSGGLHRAHSCRRPGGVLEPLEQELLRPLGAAGILVRLDITLGQPGPWISSASLCRT